VTSRICSTASLLIDLPVSVDALPPRGGGSLGQVQQATAGGGFNVLAAVARQGPPAHALCPLGDGWRAEVLVEALAAEGAVHSGSRRPGEDNGLCLTLLEPDGERSFITSPGTESRVCAEDLPEPEEMSGDFVYVSGYDLLYPDAGGALAAWLVRLPATTRLVLDPAPMVAHIPDGRLDPVLARVDLLTLNGREAALLAGGGQQWDDELWPSLLARLGTEAVVVLRRGADGCLLHQPHRPVSALVPPAVTAVDTTGAGDAHAGVMMAGLLQGQELEQAVALANLAAADSVTRPGPATCPDADRLAQLLRSGALGAARRDRRGAAADASR